MSIEQNWPKKRKCDTGRGGGGKQGRVGKNVCQQNLFIVIKPPTSS